MRRHAGTETTSAAAAAAHILRACSEQHPWGCSFADKRAEACLSADFELAQVKLDDLKTVQAGAGSGQGQPSCVVAPQQLQGKTAP